MKSFVIVGAGQAAGRAAEAMRKCGFDGSITMIGDEPHPPYERPPLSKKVLSGASLPQSCYLHDPAFYEEQGVTLRLGRRAVRIERSAHRLLLDDGEAIAYDKLLLATGGRARRLDCPGSDLKGIQYLRTLDDSIKLCAALQPGRRLVLVGGGYIGLEVAATARRLGCAVCVVEATSAVMSRVAAPEISSFLTSLHRNNGVDIRVGTGVSGFEGNEAVTAVICRDGSCIPADVVVVGVGMVPNVELARDAGLEVEDGVVVDANCRTSDPSIYAAGDVANQADRAFSTRFRLESWQNAQNQGIAAARNMCGEELSYGEIPWFWSDQYDVNLQMVGRPTRWDRVILRGEPEACRFTAFYMDRNHIVGASMVNDARNVRPVREIIASGRLIDDPTVLSDPRLSLRDLIPVGAR